jgi:hypothetical protein
MSTTKSPEHEIVRAVNRLTGRLTAGCDSAATPGGWRKRPEGAVSAAGLLDGGGFDLYGFALITYFVLLLGCAIRFAIKIGAFSPRRRRQQGADETLSDSSLL